MIGTLFGLIATGYVCKKCYENHKLKDEVKTIKNENKFLKITFYNYRYMLRNYDNINVFAKKYKFKGAVDFFKKLSLNYDNRFYPLYKFISRVYVIRNSFAHRGTYYQIDQAFIEKLNLCYKVCFEFQKLPKNTRLMITHK